MVRPLVTGLLVGLVLLSTQHLLFVQSLFVLRQAYVAEHLCVNRDHPEMKCNGRCYLKKQLAAHEHAHAHEDEQAAVLEVLMHFSLWRPEAGQVHTPAPHAGTYAAFDRGAGARGAPAALLRPPIAS